MTPSVALAPDPRWREVFHDQAALDEHANRWPVGAAVPDDMPGVLRVARMFLVHSYLVYEYALIAVTWSLLALEAGLYVCLAAQGKQELGPLIRQAKQRGLVTEDEVAALEGARTLRNTRLIPRLQGFRLPTARQPSRHQRT